MDNTMQSQHTAQMTCDMVFTKCRKSHKYCNIFPENIITHCIINVKRNCIKRALESFSFLSNTTPCRPYQTCGLATILKNFFFCKKNIVISDFCMYNASTINNKI